MNNSSVFWTHVDLADVFKSMFYREQRRTKLECISTETSCKRESLHEPHC